MSFLSVNCRYMVSCGSEGDRWIVHSRLPIVTGNLFSSQKKSPQYTTIRSSSWSLSEMNSGPIAALAV